MAQNLDPLPESGDEYWKGADVQQHVLKPQPECQHEFIRSGHEAECKNCHIGFFLSPELAVKKGHIYKILDDSEQLII